MLEKLKGLALDRMSIDEEVELVAVARNAKSTYESLEIPVPDWIVDGLKELETDLRRRRHDALQAELKRLQNRKAALRSREEERQDIDKTIDALNAQLGNAPGA